MVAVNQESDAVGDGGDGKKWVNLRDNQGVKLTEHCDKFNMEVKEKEEVLDEYQVCVL